MCYKFRNYKRIKISGVKQKWYSSYLYIILIILSLANFRLLHYFILTITCTKNVLLFQLHQDIYDENVQIL